MKDQVNVFKSIQQFWKSQSKKRKIIYISIVAALVITSVILSLLLNKKEYVVLYQNLESSEASKIVSVIGDMGVDAQLKDDGTILVPPEKENTLRMELGTKGYPKSSLSYDIWTNNVNMFTTDSDKREFAKMQLQERLQATIKTLSAIEECYVTLDIPETTNTVISTTLKKPTASVVLHFKPQMKLTSDQIRGIRHIVMTSISGLLQENITITDGTGKLLVEGEETEDPIFLENQRLKYKKDLENILKQEVLDMLIPAYGDGGVNVSVNSVLNYDTHIQESIDYGDGSVSEREESSESGISGDPNDIVGVTPNADGTYPTEDGDKIVGSWSSSKNHESFLVDTLKQQTEKQGYTVEKVTVSVIVYREIMGTEEKNSISNIVCNATGTTPEFVSVENIPLINQRPADEDKPASTDNAGEYFGFTLQQLIIIASLAFVLILILIIILLVIISKRRKKKRLKRQMALMAENGLDQQTDELGELLNQSPVDIPKLSSDVPDTKEAAIRREISEFSANSPEVAAQLLKSWIREDGEN